MSTTEESKVPVVRMVDALNGHELEGKDSFWHEDMVWRGPAGIGTKDKMNR